MRERNFEGEFGLVYFNQLTCFRVQFNYMDFQGPSVLLEVDLNEMTYKSSRDHLSHSPPSV